MQPIDLTTVFDPLGATIIGTLVMTVIFLWKRGERLEISHKEEITAYNKMYLELINKQFETIRKVSDALEAYEHQQDFSKLALDLIRQKLGAGDE